MKRAGISARVKVGATIVLSLMALASCQLIIGLKDPGTDPFPDEAQAPEADTPETAPPPIVDPCKHVTPPAPAATDDDPLRTIPTFYLAMEHVHLTGRLGYDAGALDGGEAGFPPNSTDFGFDLDNGCTCQQDLHEGGPSCIGQGMLCDGDGGVDNGLHGLYLAFGALGDIDDLSTINQRILGGDQALMMRIDNYNGLANDNDVQVTVVLITRPAQSPDSRCGKDAGLRYVVDDGGDFDGANYAPAFDGCDRWELQSDAPAIQAYVVNHQIVAVAQATVPVIVGSATIDVRFPQFTGVLVPRGDGTFTLEDGVLAGRAPADSMFGAFMTFKVHTGGDPACFHSEYVAAFRQNFCRSLDIMSSSAADYRGFSCDAVSFVFAFRAGPAWDGPRVALPKTGDCADSGMDLTCDLTDAADGAK